MQWIFIHKICCIIVCETDWLRIDCKELIYFFRKRKEKRTLELLGLLNMKRFSLTKFPLRCTHSVSMLQSNFDNFNFKWRTKWNETERAIETVYISKFVPKKSFSIQKLKFSELELKICSLVKMNIWVNELNLCIE